MILRINVTEKDFQIFEKIDTIGNYQIFNEKKKKKIRSIIFITIKKRIFEIDRSIENSITKRARFSKTE